MEMSQIIHVHVNGNLQPKFALLSLQLNNQQPPVGDQFSITFQVNSLCLEPLASFISKLLESLISNCHHFCG